MIKLVVFDWNGTIFADTAPCVDSCNHFFKAVRIKPITLNQFRETFTVPVIDFYEKNGVDRKMLLANSKLNAEIFHKYYEAKESKIRSRAYVRRTLSWLHDNKIKCVIISNHMVPQIKKQAKRLKIDKYIWEILANVNFDAPLLGKTKAERLETFLKKQNIRGQDLLMIGDGLEEIEIAQMLGAKSVAVTGGYYSTSRLKTAKPDYLINNLKEVTEILNKLN